MIATLVKNVGIGGRPNIKINRGTSIIFFLFFLTKLKNNICDKAKSIIEKM